MEIGVLGAGTWGIALSRMLCNMGHNVIVWSKIEKEIDELDKKRVHPNLPDMVIPSEIRFTKNIRDVLENKDIVLCAVPSVFLRSTMEEAKEYIKNGQVIVDVAKGIEKDTLLTLSEVITSVLKSVKKKVDVVALSGPTHAEEVAFDMPTAIVSACKKIKVAKFVQDAFMNDNFRVYTNKDIKGVELCGALKNIIALASGISHGLGFGDNAKAAIITRGMYEISKIGTALGCKPKTFSGLTGIGDLIVTATSMHSRNNRAGILMGQGKTAEEAQKEVGMVVEGINALPAAITLAERFKIDTPIINAVNDIVNGKAKAKDVALYLMQREKKSEHDFKYKIDTKI